MTGRKSATAPPSSFARASGNWSLPPRMGKALGVFLGGVDVGLLGQDHPQRREPVGFDGVAVANLPPDHEAGVLGQVNSSIVSATDTPSSAGRRRGPPVISSASAAASPKKASTSSSTLGCRPSITSSPSTRTTIGRSSCSRRSSPLEPEALGQSQHLRANGVDVLTARLGMLALRERAPHGVDSPADAVTRLDHPDVEAITGELVCGNGPARPAPTTPRCPAGGAAASKLGNARASPAAAVVPIDVRLEMRGSLIRWIQSRWPRPEENSPQRGRSLARSQPRHQVGVVRTRTWRLPSRGVGASQSSRTTAAYAPSSREGGATSASSSPTRPAGSIG